MSATRGKVKRPSVCKGKSVVTLIAVLLSGAGTAVPVAADWELPITASVSTMQVYSDTATAAVQTGATDGFDGYSIDQPHAPAPPVGVRIYFPHPEWGAVAGPFQRDARAQLVAGDYQTWGFEVEAVSTAGTMVLTFGLSEVPATETVILRDLVTGQRYNLAVSQPEPMPFTAGQTRRFELTVGRLPDLVVGDVSVPSPSPVPGQPLTVTATVQNRGAGNARAFGVYVYRHLVSPPATNAGASGAFGVGSLAAGQSTTVTFTVVYSTAGRYTLWVLADGTNLIPEVSEANNYGPGDGLQLVVSDAPDLVVSSVTASKTSPNPGETITISATIKNQGTGPSNPCGVYVYRHLNVAPTSNAGASGGFGIGALAAGGSQTATFSLSYSQAGAYTLWVLADGSKLVTESNEANNAGPAGGLAITVGGSGAPDLVVSGVVASKTSPSPRETITVSATIKNQGTGPSNPCGVYVYRHLNAAPTSNAGASGGAGIGALSAGASQTVTFTLSYGQAGAYTLWVLADGSKVVTESDESNNAGPAGGLKITVR